MLSNPHSHKKKKKKKKIVVKPTWAFFPVLTTAEKIKNKKIK